jgi:hypothetical protein
MIKPKTLLQYALLTASAFFGSFTLYGIYLLMFDPTKRATALADPKLFFFLFMAAVISAGFFWVAHYYSKSK